MRKAIKEGRVSGLAGLVIGRPKQRAVKCEDRGWLGPVWDLLETCLDWMLTGPYFWICPFLFLAWIRALLVWLDCCDSSFRLRRLYTVWLPNCFDGNFFLHALSTWFQVNSGSCARLLRIWGFHYCLFSPLARVLHTTRLDRLPGRCFLLPI